MLRQRRRQNRSPRKNFNHLQATQPVQKLEDQHRADTYRGQPCLTTSITTQRDTTSKGGDISKDGSSSKGGVNPSRISALKFGDAPKGRAKPASVTVSSKGQQTCSALHAITANRRTPGFHTPCHHKMPLPNRIPKRV